MIESGLARSSRLDRIVQGSLAGFKTDAAGDDQGDWRREQDGHRARRQQHK
jgi:hypothetical protein